MRADLYVYSDSFAYNHSDDEVAILTKLKNFRDLTQKVADKDNVFLFNTDEFMATELLPDGTTCGDFILGQHAYPKEISQLFFILLTSGVYHATNFTGEEIDELIEWHSEDSCSAKVVLTKTECMERSKQVLGTYEDWRMFRSYFLGLYPGDVDFFYQECSKYYPNLVFGERYKSQTKEVLVSHSEKITACLLVMDTYFMNEFRVAQCSNIDFPRIFACKYNIEGGSFEGEKDEKFNVFFADENTTLVCEPHLKFNSPDASKAQKRNINQYCRIYFSMPTSKNSTKIHIGAIVRHL
ncbi:MULTISPECIES: hypothetical protein [unclassified Butyricimonas]|uniref:hypothetical protein n=1 Tax=unclassified Butyricimonas TaxID=2637652 RepID=UPI000C0859AE|nr:MULTISPECIES: hypothetical protein [unclassified Butyricimonas]